MQTETSSPELANIKAFGTDEEINVYRSLQTYFKDANHLLYSIHVKENVSKKLTDLNVDQPELFQRFSVTRLGMSR